MYNISNTIITNWLQVKQITLINGSEAVYIEITFGCLRTGAKKPLLLCTDLDTLKNLMQQADTYPDELLENISDYLAKPALEQQEYDPPMQPFEVSNTIILFAHTRHLDEPVYSDLGPTYYCVWNIIEMLETNHLLPRFSAARIRKKRKNSIQWYEYLMAIQYLFYLHIYNKSTDEFISLTLTDLRSPAIFELARLSFNTYINNQPFELSESMRA